MAQSPIVSRANSVQISTLPKFIQEDHPKLVEFLRIYYEWSAKQHADGALESIKLNNDIDTALPELMDTFRQSFAKHFPAELQTDFRHFAKFLKEFYQLKGSGESYRIFFRAVFNELVRIYFPRQELLKASGAVWTTSAYLTIDCTHSEPYKQIGREIVGTESGANAIINDIQKVGQYFYFFIEDINGTFEPGESIMAYLDNEKVYSVVKPVFMLDGISSAAEWHDNDVVKIDDNGVILKVERIEYSPIIAMTIVNGGAGYEILDRIKVSTNHLGAGFVAQVNGVSGSGAITSIQIVRKGFAYNHEDVAVSVDSVGGTGAVLTPVFNDKFRKVKHASIISTSVFPDGLESVSSVVGGTTFNLKPVALTTLNQYTSNNGMPSSLGARIHDSAYYQEYSYEIQSKARFLDYEDGINKLLHIAGLKQYGKSLVELRATPIAPPSLIL